MKRFTRYVSLILVLVIVFLVPVSADDLDNTGSWINVLDYATLNNSGSNYITFSNSITVSFDTDIKSIVRFVDIVVNTAGADISSASINGNSLTVVGLDSQVFRIYGSVGNITTGKYDLTLSASGTCYLDFFQFHVNGQYRLSYPDIGSVNTGSRVYTQSSSSSYVTFTVDPEFNELTVTSANWKRYDFLDFTFRYYDDQGGISSISAEYNGIVLPVSVSRWTSNDKVEDTVNNSFFWRDCYWVTVRVDLRGLDRTIVASPKIHFTCGSGSFYLMSTVGSVAVDAIDPITLFRHDVEHWFAWLGDKQETYFSDLNLNLSSLFDTMAQRQDAYHSDLEDWNIENMQNLGALFDSVTDLLSDVSADIKSIHSTLLVKFDSLINKLSTFQSSMENYLEQLPARIAEEIAKIFKPTEGKFEAAKDESQELAEEKLGAVYQSAVVIDQIAGAFTVQTPQTSIVIPLVSVEVLPGVPFQFGGWDVPIVPSGLEFLIDTLKYVIDIVCTLAFLNGMKRRLDGFFGGESGVD